MGDADRMFPPLPPTRRAQERQRNPIWMEPPPDELAVLVPVRRVLARTDRVAVVLSHVDAHRAGARLHLHVVGRRLPTDSDERWGREHERLSGHGFLRAGGRPPGPLRVGVRHAEGTTTDTRFVHDHPARGEDGPPQPHLMVSGGGGGGGTGFLRFSHHAWLWPLPPPGPLELGIEWQDVGIAETVTTLDGAAIVAAADDVVPMWPGGGTDSA